jgi:hypothetical protein
MKEGSMKPKKKGWDYVAIVGSRDYPDRGAVSRYMGELQMTAWDSIIVSGGAQGPDTWAVEDAEDLGLHAEVFKADWPKHGRAAGMIRNTQIVERCDRVVAFWDGISKGTLDTIRKATRAGKPVLILGPKEGA